MATPINNSSVTPPLVTTPTTRSEPVETSSGAPVAIPGQAVAQATSVERQGPAGGGSAAPAEAAAPAVESREAAEELAEATRNISDYIQSVSRSLQISVDRDLGSTIIRVLDSDTDELVRQIPSEEILEIARFIAEQRASTDSSDPIRGLLLDGEG